MATTAEYLNKLVTQKNALADNLVTKGVEATHDETLETLVPKVLEIDGGGDTGYAGGIVKNYHDFGNTEWTEIRQKDTDSFVVSDNTTIECCFKIISIESGVQGRIFETQNVGGSLRYCINNNNGVLEISFNGSVWNSIPEYVINTDVLYTISAVMHDSTTDVYVNGALITTLSARVATDNTIYKIMMKTSWATNGRRIQGNVYSLRMYNRALSDSEISQNWQTDIKKFG